jgi:hypothetical protein
MMSADRDNDEHQRPIAAPGDAESEREDWDPMTPETTVPDPEADQVGSEEEWNRQQEEERPA